LYLDKEVKNADEIGKIIERFTNLCFKNYLFSDYKLWTAGCQMTPSAADIITGRWRGLRDMADKVNRNVTKW